MAKKATNKKPKSGNLVSHSNRKTRHQQKLNLQQITVDGKKVRVTAREAKKSKKNTA